MATARAPLLVTPETLDLRVGSALVLRVHAPTGAEIVWFHDGEPCADQAGATCSILAVQERHQGAYRAVVQQGPFSHAGVAAMTDISEPAYVFVQPVDAPEKDASCAICLSVVPTRERFRFRRKAEESYNSGFRNLSPAGTFAEELQYCSHDFHRVCVQSYAEHAILSDGRWCVRCAQPGCAYQLYTSDVRELCGASSPAFTRFCELKLQDFSERLRQVQAGEDVDSATRGWMAENCDVCPGCQAIVYKDAGCQSITCTCDARFVHGQHRHLAQ